MNNDYLYNFTLNDLIEFLDDEELTQGKDRNELLEIALQQEVTE